MDDYFYGTLMDDYFYQIYDSDVDDTTLGFMVVGVVCILYLTKKYRIFM